MADIVFPGQLAGVLGQNYLPSNYDLKLYQGDFFAFSITLKDALGDPFSLTGYTAKCTIRASYGATEAFLATCSVTAAEGKIDVLFPSTVTATIEPGDYIWDFQVTNPDGNHRTYLTGDVQVYGEVSS